MREIERNLAVLAQAQDLRLFRARHNREAARQRLFRVAMVCGLIGPLGALFVHLLVFGRVVRRLAQVEENARRLAQGLPLAATAEGGDEIARLAREIEDAAFRLRDRERELRESERKYRDLFDHAPIPFQEIDCQGVVRQFNQAVCDLLKAAPERIAGSLAWDFMAPDQQETHARAMLQRIQAGMEGEPFECDYFLDDDARLTVEIRETFIRNHTGAITGVCRSLLDVTERNLAAMAARKVAQYAMELRNKNEQLRRALDAARSATEAKSRFLAAVSHELRTPLNGIIGFTELMYDGKAGPVSDVQRDFLGDIQSSAHHLLRLINDVLDVSKVEAGKLEFRPEQCSIPALVGEVQEVLSPLAEKKNIRLLADVPQFDAHIDTSRFKQVLYNYLSNAVKFTPEGGEVAVRVAPAEPGYFRVEVEDTGIGIAASELPLLFQEFQQLPNSRRAGQGTGLGLALTRRIVEAQGGEVSVRSTEGRGSTFTAVLPISTHSNGT
jgi:PAS domain S-box-containing protein